MHLHRSPIKDRSFYISRFLVCFNVLSYHCPLGTHRHLLRISSAPDTLLPLCFACNYLIDKRTTSIQETFHNQVNKPQPGIYRATPSQPYWGLTGLAQADLPWTGKEKLGQVKCTRPQEPEDKKKPRTIVETSVGERFPRKGYNEYVRVLEKKFSALVRYTELISSLQWKALRFHAKILQRLSFSKHIQGQRDAILKDA